MKKMLYLLFLALTISCQENSKTSEEAIAHNNDLLSMTFKDFREIEIFEKYEKAFDTAIYTGGWEDDFRLLHLRETNENLVLFYKVVDRQQNTGENTFRVLDTLQIRNLRQDEEIIIGYCYNQNYYEGELVAVAEKTDSLVAQKILKVWRANPASGAVEAVENFKGIICLSLDYEDNGQPVSIKHLNLQSRVD
ncbi:hypothetical protein [Salinimicrobium sp. HB62]|uniref:hypothetical protein n=1 Tax=Salinimicrobium sp. HB62 TaxID=3077781 RepID=UPI002D76FE46|nr:hypothetical protein [Salinimicrobium sp. HB62]